MTLPKAKEWTDVLVPWLQVVALVCAGLFALNEYLDHKKEEKIERSVDYVTRLNSGELLDSTLKLSAQELKKNGRFLEILQDKKATVDQRHAAYFKFIVCELLQHGQEKSLEQSLDLRLGFLEDGAVCSKANLCDPDTIKSNIGDFAGETVGTYYPYLCFLRSIWDDDNIYSRLETFYSPSLGNSCQDYKESLQKAGPPVDPAHFCDATAGAKP